MPPLAPDRQGATFCLEARQTKCGHLTTDGHLAPAQVRPTPRECQEDRAETLVDGGSSSEDRRLSRSYGSVCPILKNDYTCIDIASLEETSKYFF